MTASTDETALLAAIYANPDEDTSRLALADWYDEHDRPVGACTQRLAVALRAVLARPDDDLPRLEYATICERYGEAGFPGRAEFVRAQIDAALGVQLESMRIWDLLHHCEGWWPDVCDAMHMSPHHWGVQHDGTVHYEHKMSSCEFWIRRGFVEELRCIAADWLAHADVIRAQHPVTAVRLTALFGPFDIMSEDGEWWFTSTPDRKMRNEEYNLKVNELERSKAPYPARLAALVCRWPGITFTLPS